MTPEHRQCPKCGMVLPRELCPRCTLGSAMGDSAVEPEAANAPTIPGLTVHEEVGEGGFGIVYRATQTGVVKRRVALKVLKPGVDTRQVLRRFDVERQALALLEHPNIARMYDAGETSSGYPWFTMEYIDGEPVTEYLANCDLEVAVESFLPVCGAVTYAHGKGIIHRDLKPSNVLITAEGQAKVIDFGIAKATDPEAAPGMTLYTGGEVWLGTPAYMAPEQAMESGLEPDECVDVYALGAILYEVVTGVNPLEAATGKATREVIGTGEIPKPSEVALRKVPHDLDRVILKSLEKLPENRYGSVRGFVADLRRFLNQEKIEIQRRKRRSPWLILAAAACVLGATVWAFLPKEEEPPAVAVRHESSGGPFELLVESGGSRGLGVFRKGGRAILFDPRDGRELSSLSAQGNHILTGTFSEDGERFFLGYRDGTWRMFSSENGNQLGEPRRAMKGGDGVQLIRQATLKGGTSPVVMTALYNRLRVWSEEGEALWEVPLESGPYRFVLSPDRSLAVIGSGRGQIRLIDLIEQKRLKNLEAHQGEIQRLAFTPDGSRFVSASSDGKTVIWNKNGLIHRILRHVEACESLAISHDGTRIVTGCLDGVARIWQIESGELLQELVHQDRVFCVGFSPDDERLVTGGRGARARVWSVANGESLQVFDCEKPLGELYVTRRKNGNFNLCTLTWESALRVIPLKAQLPVSRSGR